MIYRFIISLTIVFSLFTVSLPQVGYAQATATQTASDFSKKLAEIETKVEKRRTELGIPGMSLVIVKDGNIIYNKGLGYKDFEKKIPVTPDTQFGIGSATKAFTALSVLMSADEGKINLDDSPKKYLSYFKMKDPETDKNMTVRDLMDHSSGLNRTDLAMITGKLNRQQLIQVVGEAKPMAKLNERFFYNNIMFAAAGEITAKTNNMPWEKFVPARIFAPLGMTNSTMSIAEMVKSKDYSFGYDYNFDTKETRKLPFRPIDDVAPAGSINSSANDMAKWIKFVMNNGTVDNKRLVSEKNYDEWTKPQNKITPNGKISYGLGWFLREWNGMKVVEHGGNIDGFNSLVAMIPEKKLGFVMLTNVSGSSLGSELMPIIWEGILGKPETPKPETPKVDSSIAVSPEKEVGKYKFAEAGFDLEIKIKEGNLVAEVPGQPTYTLENIGGRKYKLKEVEGFFVTFKDDSVYLEQPQGNFTLPKAVTKPTGTAATENTAKELIGKDATPNITVNEIMKKTVEALGGESAMRKITSRVTKMSVDFENQGLKGTGITYEKTPNLATNDTFINAFGKTIGTVHSYFDGTNGGSETSFFPPSKATGKALENAKINNEFYEYLTWKNGLKKSSVTGIEKVGDEDCYVVLLEPEKASEIKYWISTKTFLPLKQRTLEVDSTNQQSTPSVAVFSDYRAVDGVKIPFKVVVTDQGMGNIVFVTTEVKQNVKIDNKVFKPKSK